MSRRAIAAARCRAEMVAGAIRGKKKNVDYKVVPHTWLSFFMTDISLGFMMCI